jgi:hypothetical protein
MKTATMTTQTEAEIWFRILHPDEKLTPKVARAILNLSFPASDLSRMHELSRKAQEGELTSEENDQMDAFERAGSLLSVLKSKARQTLK